EFSNHIRKRGLDGGILAIPQRFPRAAHALGRAHRVDLLDSDSMWEEMQPLLSEDQHAAIDRPAHARMHVQLVVAWVLAIALAVATYLSIKPRPEVGAITPPAATAPAGAAEAATPPLPLQPPATPARTVEQRRQAVAGDVASLAHVTSASWPAESTLLVVTDSADFDPRAGICPLLEPDPDLAASRLQIRHPPGSAIPVRFLQCRAY